MGTFHSICVKILRREATHIGYPTSFTIYDTQDQLAVVKKIHDDFQVKFHTIGIGEAIAPANAAEKKPTLLKQMAESTGGTYTER